MRKPIMTKLVPPYLIGCALLFCIVGSCDNGLPMDETENTATDQTEGIVFTPIFEGAPVDTRAYNSSWVNNDSVGIFMMTHDYASTLKKNAKHTAKQGSSWMLSAATKRDAIYYPQSDEEVNFIAYYPYQSGADMDKPLEIVITEQTETNNAFDILYATNDETTTRAFGSMFGYSANLSFQHILGKVIINIKKSSGASSVNLSQMEVILQGFPVTGWLNLRWGTVTPTSRVADIEAVALRTPNRGYDRSYQAIILPSTGTAFSARTIVCKYKDAFGKDKVYSYSIPYSYTFSSGQSQTYNITITNEGVTFGDATITNWYTLQPIEI
ncbi:MAG: fimbrillin family protein [Prevotellaceae bacterium]|nr:fimbrillin family protein [Prevotellaceae bacterium]